MKLLFVWIAIAMPFVLAAITNYFGTSVPLSLKLTLRCSVTCNIRPSVCRDRASEHSVGLFAVVYPSVSFASLVKGVVDRWLVRRFNRASSDSLNDTSGHAVPLRSFIGQLARSSESSVAAWLRRERTVMMTRPSNRVKGIPCLT